MSPIQESLFQEVFFFLTGCCRCFDHLPLYVYHERPSLHAKNTDDTLFVTKKQRAHPLPPGRALRKHGGKRQVYTCARFLVSSLCLCVVYGFVSQQYSLLGLLEGDVVLAHDVEAPQYVSFTVKLEQSGERGMFLLARRGETSFSVKLRLWARRVLRRPSTTA